MHYSELCIVGWRVDGVSDMLWFEFGEGKMVKLGWTLLSRDARLLITNEDAIIHGVPSDHPRMAPLSPLVARLAGLAELLAESLPIAAAKGHHWL